MWEAGSSKLIDLRRRQVELVAIVHLHHGRRLARAQALDGLQRDAPVPGRLPDLDPQPALDVGEDLRRAGEVAGEVVADGDDVAALGLAEVERVEGHHLVHVRGREPEETGDVLFGVERDVPERVLGHVEHRQQRPARVGIQRLKPPDLGELFG